MRSILLILVPGAAVLAAEGLYFEPNLGQSAPEVRYVARARGAAAFLTADAVALAPGGAGDTSPVEMRLSGASPLDWHPLGRVAGSTSYEVGPRERWVSAVPHYSRVISRGVYPGIDWVVHGTAGRIEHDFVVAPGADPGSIEIVFSNTRGLERSASGELLLRTGDGVLTHKAPVAYVETAAGRGRVAASYRITGPDRARFSVGAYDRSRTLVIDPVIESATWLGGEGSDTVVAIGPEGRWLAGSTASVEFPWPAGKRRGVDAFWYDAVGKSTRVFGGSGDDIVTCATDGVLAGYTNSPDLTAATAYPWKGAFSGGKWDGFAIFLRDGRVSYVGGSGDDRILAVSRDGRAFAGSTDSTDFPLAFAWQTELGGGVDGFAILPRATSYLGGSGDDRALAVETNTEDGSIYSVAGETSSPGWIAETVAGESDGFLMKVESTYPAVGRIVETNIAGGPGRDAIAALCPESANGLVMAGHSEEAGRGWEAFVARVGAWKQTFGGEGDETVTSLSCSANGDAALGGFTSSRDFPLSASAVPYAGGPTDGFVTAWNSGGGRQFSLLYGGTGTDRVTAVNLSGLGVQVAGVSDSARIPLVNPRKAANSGGLDIFQIEISESWISAPPELYVGRDLTALAGFRVQGGNGAALPVTFRSADSRRVLLSTSPAAAGAAAVTVEFGDGRDPRTRAIWAQCRADQGESTVTATAPGQNPVETIVRCVPSVILTSGAFAADLGNVRLWPAASVPMVAQPVPQRLRTGAEPVRVQVRIEPESARRGIPTEITLDTGSTDGTPLASRILSGPPEPKIVVTLDSSMDIVPGNRITVGGLYRQDFAVPVLSPGSISDIRYARPPGKAVLRVTDPSRVLLRASLDQPGAESLELPPDAGRVFVEGLTLGGYEVIAEFEGWPPLRARAAVNPWIAEFLRPLVPRGSQPASELTVSVGSPLTVAIGVSPVGWYSLFLFPPDPSPPRPIVPRFRLESSSPAVIVREQTEPGVPRLSDAVAAEPGESLLRLVPEGEPAGLVSGPLRVTVLPAVPAELRVGKNLQTRFLAGGPFSGPITVTSSDPSKVTVSTGLDRPGGGSTPSQSQFSNDIWVRSHASEGTVELITSDGVKQWSTIVTLTPSGLAWTSQNLDLLPEAGESSPTVAAWRLDPDTLAPVEIQAIAPGFFLAAATVSNSAPSLIFASAYSETLSPLKTEGKITVQRRARGVSQLAIQQPAGFTRPSQGVYLDVRAR